MMQAAPTPDSMPGGSPRGDEERPAGARRILAAAIGLFGEQGVAATSLKTIGARAGVSPALIVHHFGSKEGLRTACDMEVAGLLRSSKSAAVAEGTHLSPVLALSMIEAYRPAMRYLARTLTDGSRHVNDLMDELVADAEEYTAEAERLGLVRPSADPKARIAVMMLMSMGTLVLHEHLERLIGEDLLGEGPPLRYIRTAMEVLGVGIFTEGAYDDLREFVSDRAPTEEDIP